MKKLEEKKKERKRKDSTKIKERMYIVNENESKCSR